MKYFSSKMPTGLDLELYFNFLSWLTVLNTIMKYEMLRMQLPLNSAKCSRHLDQRFEYASKNWAGVISGNILVYYES